MWHTTSTAAAIKPAAMIPQTCEMRVTIQMKRSMCPPTHAQRACSAGAPAGRPGGQASLHGERRVDQLLAVRHLAGEVLVRAVLRDLDPGVVLGARHGRDLDVVLLKH